MTINEIVNSTGILGLTIYLTYDKIIQPLIKRRNGNSPEKQILDAIKEGNEILRHFAEKNDIAHTDQKIISEKILMRLEK